MILFIIYVILSTAGLILFKLGGTAGTQGATYINSVLSVSLSIKSILGILCYGISFILWLLIVQKSDLSFIYPLSVAVINILILTGSHYFLGESITVWKMVGIALIVAGIFVMNIKGK
ncbi:MULTISPECIES: hypothetical protein [Erysipelothrix]|uniref:hypothetical protein n=1 Tax=Erysipelothrix TaxID=1647 RepID=UPI001359291D|nr:MULTISPECIES: hypothetical protein [Erysipelothrix]